MDGFEKALRLKRILIAVACVVTVVLLVVSVMLGISRWGNPASQPTNPTVTTSPADDPATRPSDGTGGEMKELLLQDVSEQGNVIVVTTTYCAVSYPVGFEEVITAEVQMQENDPRIVFYATIGGEKHALYALLFNGREGIPLGHLRVEGDIYSVSAIFYDPEGVSGEGLSTFNAAQETFNDVAMSLEENKNFWTE